MQNLLQTKGTLLDRESGFIPPSCFLQLKQQGERQHQLECVDPTVPFFTSSNAIATETPSAGRDSFLPPIAWGSLPVSNCCRTVGNNDSFSIKINAEKPINRYPQYHDAFLHQTAQCYAPIEAPRSFNLSELYRQTMTSVDGCGNPENFATKKTKQHNYNREEKKLCQCVYSLPNTHSYSEWAYEVVP